MSNKWQREINRIAGKRTGFTKIVVQGSGLWSVVKMNLMVWIWKAFFSCHIFFLSFLIGSDCSTQAHRSLHLSCQTGDLRNLKTNPAIGHCGTALYERRSCKAGQCKRKKKVQWLVLVPVWCLAVCHFLILIKKSETRFWDSKRSEIRNWRSTWVSTRVFWKRNKCKS